MSAPKPSRAKSSQALAWHYRLQRGLYCRHQLPLKGARWVADPDLGDPEWNHIALLDAPARDLPALLAEAEQRLAALGRPPFVMLAPESVHLSTELESLGWRSALAHDWVFHPPNATALQETVEEDDLVIEPVRDLRQMQCFLEIFYAAFGAVDGELDPGHSVALMQSFEAPPDDVEVVHFLGCLKDRPVVIGTAIHGQLPADSSPELGAIRSASGFYNLAVRPELRGERFGERLNRVRIQQALDRGSELIFLQTASRRLAEWHQRNGWTISFTVEGYQPVL